MKLSKSKKYGKKKERLKDIKSQIDDSDLKPLKP
jgi:hypothetical protein